MKPNYVVFVVLSFVILIGWNQVVMKKFNAPDPAPAPAGAQAPAAAERPAPSPAAAHPVEVSVGRHEISFNAQGAGLLQWTVRDDEGEMVPLVLPDPGAENPLSLFPALAFRAAPASDGAAFEAERADGLRVREEFKVDPDRFLHTLSVALTNAGKEPVDASFELGWGPGVQPGGEDGKMDEPRALALEEKRLWKLKPGLQTGAFRWFGVDARYFLAAFLNEGSAPLTLRTEKKGDLFSVRRVEKVVLAPGETRKIAQRFYAGPKGHDRLAALGLGLERSVDFGFFSTLGLWIYRTLIKLHGLVGNFGWAIILLTFGVQVLVSPLTVSSFNHSQKMKTLQPQVKRLQEINKGNPQRLNQEMLALYQRNGLRFMGMEGCLPMVVQMPVFFALYAVFSKIYELRGSPWMGWVKDLSHHDPFYVLPVLMGVAMFFQQKMTAATADPSQKQLMYIMPVVFTFIFLKMPSGLVVYWLTNSLLTLALQLILLKRQESKQENVL